MGLELVSAKPTFFETKYASRGELSGRPVPYDSEDLPKVVDYSLEWDINPNHPDSCWIVITTAKHTTPFRLNVDSSVEFLTAAHMPGKSSVAYDFTTGKLVVPQRPAGT
jgi:hypothetical protein